MTAHDHDEPDMGAISDWEDQLGRRIAQRLCARARAELRARTWHASDLEGAIERLERRLTERQRDLLWDAITRDVELAELAAGIQR